MVAAENDSDYQLLLRAIKRSDITAVRNALESDVSPNLTDRFGWTLLMTAAYEGVVKIGQLLIGAGADTNMRYGCWTALLCSISGGHPRFAKLLIENGADLDIGTPAEKWLSMYHHDGRTMTAIASLLQKSRTNALL